MFAGCIVSFDTKKIDLTCKYLHMFIFYFFGLIFFLWLLKFRSLTALCSVLLKSTNPPNWQKGKRKTVRICAVVWWRPAPGWLWVKNSCSSPRVASKSQITRWSARHQNKLMLQPISGAFLWWCVISDHARVDSLCVCGCARVQLCARACVHFLFVCPYSHARHFTARLFERAVSQRG